MSLIGFRRGTRLRGSQLTFANKSAAEFVNNLRGKDRDIGWQRADQGERGCSGGDEGEGAVLFAGGADGDFDVLAEGGEKFHKAADAEVAGAIAHEQ